MMKTKKLLGWLLVILSILIALGSIDRLRHQADPADAISKAIPEFLICAGIGVYGLYVAGVVTAKSDLPRSESNGSSYKIGGRKSGDHRTGRNREGRKAREAQAGYPPIDQPY